jgi:hypothetical protein
MQDKDTAGPWREPSRGVRIALTGSFTGRKLDMRIFAAIAIAIAIVITALTAVSGPGWSAVSGSHISIAADGNCPATMVWDGTNCVNG